MSNFMADKTVLLPYDFSDAADAAVKEALEMVDKTTKLFVLHVLVPLNMVSAEPGLIDDVTYDEVYREGCLARMKERVRDEHDRIDVCVHVGNPGYEIVEYAKKIDADFIIMASHGRTGISRLLLGSVAERVLRLSECPVIVLRHPKPETSTA